ncbi:LCP family protein [Sinomonas halotolerans]|uniref:LCP family protein n=1 Tax=Sinomonas halotolerans TaxID=1644133 RepID=A0ABU9WVR6_9MICC
MALRSPGRIQHTDPLRHPEGASPAHLTKRAFTLLALTVLVPGSAQLMAGNRRLGRRALAVTVAAWALLGLAIVVALVNRGAALTAVTHPVLSLVLVAVLTALAIGWAVLFIDTLRLIRVPLLEKRMRPVVVIALVLAMVATSGSLAYAAYLIGVGRSAIGSIFGGGPAIEPVDGRYNFLVMGGDAGEDRVGRRPDSLSVVSVDAESGRTALISIPRNLQNAQFAEGSPMRQVYPEGYNCGNECLINAINTEVNSDHRDLYPGVDDPGAHATMEAVSGTLGLTIQAYVIVDMGGFEQLIDALGGVRVKAGGWVPISGESLDDYGGHAQPKGWIAPGEQRLDGYHALWYGRSREFASDYDRIARQQCIQQAMINQLNPTAVLTKFQDIAEAGTKVVESNISSGQLGSFVDLALKGKGEPVGRMVVGPPDFDASFPTYPDFDAIHAKVDEVIAASSGSADDPKGSASGARTTTTAGGVSGHSGGVGLAAPALIPSLPVAAARAGAVPVPAGPYNEVGPDGVPVTAERLDHLFSTGQNELLTAIVAGNGECTPL